MKKVLFVLVLFCLAACNYDAGKCWLRGEEEGGVGGGPIAPGWGGDYGNAPPEPQDGTGPSGSDADAEVPKQPLLFAYGPDAFKFVVTRPWDGNDGAGGWQEATTKLMFTKPKPQDESDGCTPSGSKTVAFSCGLLVEMPVRTSTKTISTKEAARLSANAATAAYDAEKWKDGDTEATFCKRFAVTMERKLNPKGASIGARVTRTK
jgi:hypothetical protein